MQLASLEKRCNEKAGEIEDLKRSIIDRLAEEEQEQEEKLRDHAAETKAKKDKKNIACIACRHGCQFTICVDFFSTK